MEETAAGGAPAKKSGTTLSVDRAAFLLLRVRKAFKKKRQQRKERQAQQSSAAAGGSASVGSGGVAGSGLQSRTGSRKLPPPLLRSRTLPAIIVPGLPVVSLHTDKQAFQLEERLLGSKSRSGSASGHRWSLLTRAGHSGGASSTSSGNPCNTTSGTSTSSSSNNNNNNNNTHVANNNNTLMVKSLNLPKDDSSLVYRRKSSGSTPHHHQTTHQQQQHQQHQQQQQQQYQVQLQQQHLGDSSLFQLSDDFECHADGSLLLRIPAPHVVAARAYRLAARKRAAATSEATTPLAREQTLHELPLVEASASASASGSSSASSSGTTFTRLAKLLHQSSGFAGRSNLQPPPGDTTSVSLGLGLGLGEDAPRRLSWERRKDSSSLQRSASIDSFAEIVFSDLPRPSLAVTAPGGGGCSPSPFSKRPSASSLYSTSSFGNTFGAQAQAQLNVNYVDLGFGASGTGSATGSSGGHLHHHPGNGSSSASSSRRESMLSPSSTRRSKLTRIINGEYWGRDLILSYKCSTGDACHIDREVEVEVEVAPHHQWLRGSIAVAVAVYLFRCSHLIEIQIRTRAARMECPDRRGIKSIATWTCLLTAQITELNVQRFPSRTPEQRAE
ncbi:Hypothetical predicted protein [Drosophila guanche]|uniref:Uncharacterized protein n=1 Tax=Drosophila guanche TaxID=7266 RepID=A0A3B0K3B9_DROGU|nr:Hypothetical predicted protein [Drosophila guanche]